MSKGSGRRPEAKPGVYAENHERIFGKRTPAGEQAHTPRPPCRCTTEECRCEWIDTTRGRLA